MKQRWKGGKDKPTIIHGDFTTPFSVMSKASSPKINQDIDSLKNISYQLVVIEISGIFHSTKAKHTYISSVHESFLR